MKNIKFIIAIIITAIVFTSIGAIAVSSIQASQISYTKNGVDTTVDAALNDLYTTQTTTISDLNSRIENIIDFSPSTGWTKYGGAGWSLGTTSTNRLTLEVNKTYLVEILGGINRSNTTIPTINTTFTNATCTLINTRVDYNGIIAGSEYHFWYIKLYKCVPTQTTVTITQNTTTNDYNWFYTNAYEL